MTYINSESISISLQKSKASVMATRRRTSSPSWVVTHFTVLATLLLLATMPMSTMAAKKRLSRDELPVAAAVAAASPIEKAAEAPLGDNLATASDSDSVSVSAPNTAPSSPDGATASAEGDKEPTASDDAADASFQSMMDECDPDMIGFEIITG